MRSLRRGWKAGVAVALAVLACLAAYLAVAAPSYTATAVIALLPQPDASPSGELVRISVPTYARLATSDAVAASVAERFDVDRDRVAAAVRADLPPGSNTVLVSVRWGDPAMASELANGVADELLAFSDNDPLLRSMLVASALPPTSPAFPTRESALVLGIVLALGAGVTAALVRSRVVSRSRRSPDQDVAQPSHGRGPVQADLRR